MTKLNLAVIFGSRSVEHEVSIITALQIIEVADKAKYNVIPVYIDKTGRWHTGQALLDVKNYQDPQKLLSRLAEVHLSERNLSQNGLITRPTKIDVAIPAIHGTFGEDGTLQGLLEMAQIPYTTAGVLGSAVAMDKIMQKDVLASAGLPVVPYVWFTRDAWQENPQNEIAKVEKKLKYPVFVKPSNLGSTVAVTRATNRKSLKEAVDLACFYDRRIIVEQGIENIIEINCSVLGYKNLEVSICEQPIKSEKTILTYEDKYLKGGKTKGMASLSRLIPAPISESLTKKIQAVAKEVFRVLDQSGLTRIDFLVNPNTEKFYVCEPNNPPGSMSFYLWEKSGYPFPKLIDKLVEIAQERHADRQKTTYSIQTNLLEKQSQGSKI